MMGYANKSTASGLRSHRTSPGALATAGILALSLVVAPSDLNDPKKTEGRPVQIASFALLWATTSGALLEKLIVGAQAQAQAVVAVTPVVDGTAVGVTTSTAGVTTPLTFVRVAQPSDSPTQATREINEPVVDPATRAAVNSAASAAAIGPTANPFIDAILLAANPILGPALAAGFVVFFFGMLIPAAFINFVVLSLLDAVGVLPLLENLGGLLPLPLAGVGGYSATFEADATPASTVISTPLLSDSARTITATADSPDPAPTIDTKKAKVTSPTGTAIDVQVDEASAEETATKPDEANEDSTMETEIAEVEEDSTADEAEFRQVSTEATSSRKDVVETDETEEGSTGAMSTGASEPMAGSDSDASSSASSSSIGGSSSDGDTSGGEAGVS